MMKGIRMNKSITILFTMMFFCLAVFNTAYSSTEMDNPDFFLKMGIGARPYGMGGAFTAVADDANATYYNPAGLSDLKYWEVFSMHSNSYDFDVNYDYTNLVIPLLPGKVMGVSYATLKTDDIPITRDKIPAILGYASDKETALILSYGHRLSDYVALGANVKQLEQKLYIGEASGTEADFSILYTPSKTMRFGINFQDLLPTAMTWNTGSTVKIPMTTRIGTAIHLHDWGTILALDINKVQDRDIQYNGGMEYQFNNSLQGRCGFNDGDFTAGFSYIRDSWRIDYAFKRAELGDTNRFSTGFRFNTFLLERFFKRPSKPQCGKHKINLGGCDASCSSGNASKGGSSLGGTLSGMSKLTPGGQALNAISQVDSLQNSNGQPDINKVLAKTDDVVIRKSRKFDPRNKADKLLAQGNKLLLSGKYEEAETAYTEVVRMSPNREDGHLKLAGIYHYQKRYEEAIEEYKDAIATNPSNLDNYMKISTLYSKLNEFDKAAEAALIVTKLAPGSPKAKMAEHMYNIFSGNKSTSSSNDGRLKLKPVKIGFDDEITFENERDNNSFQDRIQNLKDKMGKTRNL